MANDIDCRGSRLVLRVGTKLYTVDLKDVSAKILAVLTTYEEG